MALFCKDCRHSKVIDEPYNLVCVSPNNSVPSSNTAKYLVTGIEQPTILAMRGADCEALRMARPPEIDRLVCGPDGKWFEKKEGE